ncbi:putative nucleic acid-binding protein [Sphingomonas sp. UYAg733]
MLLVDTGIWIDYLRLMDFVLARELIEGRVLGHTLVTGEIAMGSLADRVTVLNLLRRLPQAVLAANGEVIELIERQRLYSLGLGFIDAHLLAATMLTPDAKLWTRDRRLREVAERLGIAGEPGA